MLKFTDKLLQRGTVINIYGPTEATIYATLTNINNADYITIGRPLRNIQVYVLNTALQPVPVGVSGELFIGGEVCFQRLLR